MRLYQQITGIRKKRICKLIVVTILFLSISTVFFNSTIVVYAWSAGGLRSTIASIIVSMLMSSGAGVTNMDWLNQLNTAYGVESSIGTLENAISQGLLTESGGALIDTGLSDAIMANTAYTDLGIDALFTTTADDALIQAGTIAASGGANIAEESISAVTLGTVGQAFIAVGAGIGLGVLAHHVIDRFGKFITQGMYINEDSIVNDYVPDGSSYSFNSRIAKANGTNISNLYVGNIFPFKYFDNNSYKSGFVVLENGNVNHKNFSNGNFDNEDTTAYSINSSPIFSYNANYVTSFTANGYGFNSKSDFDNWLAQYKAGSADLPTIHSPDIVGAQGNAVGEYDNGYHVPSITPYYNPQERGLSPIDMDDYLEFAESANDLTDEDKVGADQADNFEDFINPYLMENEPVIPEPDPDYTDPSVIPDQPDFNPKMPVTAEDISDSDPYTTPDLMDRFPFCIPSDILSIFQKFKMNREAPVIDWEFKYDAIGLDHHLIIDFEDYNDAASLLRTLELILFVVGLGVATRKLIGA